MSRSCVNVLPLQESFRFDGRHAARARRRDGLPVRAVLHVARMEHARDIGARAALATGCSRPGPVSIWPLKTLVFGMCPMATKKPSTSCSQIAPVFRLRSFTPVTMFCETS